MNNILRNEKQAQWAEIMYNTENKHFVCLISPRAGKCRMTINFFEKYINPSILIVYPEKNIQSSWKNDLKSRNYDDNNITWSTFQSLKKLKDKAFDIVVIDEIHLLSSAQLIIVKEILKINPIVIGLTGTLNTYSERDLRAIGLSVLMRYSIQEAIVDGLITDYFITVLEVPLDNKQEQAFGKKIRTEKKQFDSLSYVINQFEEIQRDTFFLRLQRMRVIMNSLSKIQATRKLLKQFENERILVFCGNTTIADNLGITSYHSKSTEKDIVERFQKGEINQLSVCKLLNQGITFSNLNKVIVGYSDSNSENLCQKLLRAMSLDFNNPDKKAEIYIISTNEPVEQKWITKALSFFDKEKIKTIKL